MTRFTRTYSDEERSVPIWRAKPLPRPGAVRCSSCQTEWTDLEPHFMRRMIAAGWQLSTEQPHNLCPQCVRARS